MCRYWIKELPSIFIGVSIRLSIVQLNDRKEQSKTQSLIYQNQLALKEHVKNFAINLSRFAGNYANQNQDWEYLDEFRTSYLPEINNYTKELNAEGIWSTNLAKLFDQSRSIGTASETATNLLKVAAELTAMADRLPKDDSIFENKEESGRSQGVLHSVGPAQ